MTINCTKTNVPKAWNDVYTLTDIEEINEPDEAVHDPGDSLYQEGGAA